MDVKTLCLGVLSMGDASGYEIKKVFEDSFSHFYVAGFGSIYPALAELTRLGHVTCSNIEQEKRPAKKVYHLTDAGLQAFRQTLSGTHPHHRVRSDFMVLLVFAYLLPPQRVEQILATRLEDIERQLKLIDHCVSENGKSAPGTAFAAGFARTVLLAGRDYIEAQRGELLKALREKS
ncbi:MAG: PadR family transcriptional regulator [Gammaproteobacteria bacterium]|nr:PadR family transcriptional regulator [Gammaproteobacteria bacterium]